MGVLASVDSSVIYFRVSTAYFLGEVRGGNDASRSFCNVLFNDTNTLQMLVAITHDTLLRP